MRVFGSWFRLADEDVIRPIERPAKRQRRGRTPPPPASPLPDERVTKPLDKQPSAGPDDAYTSSSSTSNECTAVAVWCMDMPRPALQLTEGMNEVRPNLTSWNPDPISNLSLPLPLTLPLTLTT